MTPPTSSSRSRPAGLRGRGGGGFPTGAEVGHRRQGAGRRRSTSSATPTRATPAPSWTAASWRATRTACSRAWRSPATPSAPTQGYIYVRAEYPLAIERLEIAIRQAERLRLPRRASILGTALRLRHRDPPRRRRLRLRRGDGADRLDRGQARHAAPAAAATRPSRGLWGKPDAHQQRRDASPTSRRSSATAAPGSPAIGTEKSKGTKVFALAGKIAQHRPDRSADGHHAARDHLRHRRRHPGRQDVQGRADRRPLRRLHPGASTSTCRSTTSRWPSVGSIMGSGGMIVMDETSCMVDVARYFMEFCQDESCGKCIPCRVGTVQMHDLLDKITERARRRRGDLDAARGAVRAGQEHQPVRPGPDGAQPGAVSTLRYFRDEYLAHIDERRCPAGVCAMPRGEVARRHARGDGRERQDPHHRRQAWSAPARTRRSSTSARENGIQHPDALPPRRPGAVGACRLCLVEVEGSTKLLAACVTAVARRMEVTHRLRAAPAVPAP